MPVDVVIERATLADLDAIAALEHECFPAPWPRQTFTRELSRTDDGALYIAARAAEELVGYAGVWLVPDEAHVCTIAVAPQHRRKRIGAHMLLYLVEEAVRRGAERVVLEYRVSNAGAHKLYAKYGFRFLAVRKDYYRHGPVVEDAIVVRLDNIQEPGFSRRLRQWQRELAADRRGDDLRNAT
jgi:ribosomal-protein-alanine N-acetyltransferase